MALIYIDRLIQRNNFLLTELNVHRVVITAILLAAKFFDDAYYNNAYYAKVGGVIVSELNALEVEFLFRINFSLRVAPDVFEKYNSELISHATAMGLQSPPQCYDDFLQAESIPCISQNQEVSIGSNMYVDVEPLATQHVRVQPEACSIAPMTQVALYSQQQAGVDYAVMTQQTLQNPPQITPSPPPHPPHLHGASISYASDLAGAMYEAYPATYHQAPPSYYQQHASIDANAAASTDNMLLKMPSWPQVNAESASPGSTQHYQCTSCSHPNQGPISAPPQPDVSHQDYTYAPIEWQFCQSEYGNQHFVSSPGSDHHMRNAAYVKQVES
jgi:hypothetical protein